VDDDANPAPATDVPNDRAADLAADPRVQAVLEGTGPFHALEHLAETGSTNDVALARLRAGQRPGLVVVADLQTRGRGRRGRGWQEQRTAGGRPTNLAVTATVALPVTDAAAVPLAAGLAVVAAYHAQGASAGLKWPNDVLIGDRKAAGILVERHRVDTAEVLLVGCGLDLDWRGVERTGEAAGWTSLAETLGADVDRGAVLAALLAELGRRLRQLEHDPTRLLDELRAGCTTLGRDVEVALPDGRRLRGRATGLDTQGRLQVTTDDGPVTVTAGDVAHLRTT
jgi:BirA family biotin operon repressor/biotin-[acetyl-CoA-carboxylase] ligase